MNVKVYEIFTVKNRSVRNLYYSVIESSFPKVKIFFGIFLLAFFFLEMKIPIFNDKND